MSDLGAGIALNEDWDFEVDSTGDLLATTGIAELEKDVAFNVAREWEDSIGRRVDASAKKQIQITAQSVLLSDDRIDTVNNVTARQVNGHANKFEVVADVDTIVSGSIDLIFEVSL